MPDVRGENHGMAKLVESDILAIRADPRVQRVIAAEYGIQQQHVSQIKRRTRWAHIE